jgi:polyvinyl alcohol dehydrogenase (cytochrome)
VGRRRYRGLVAVVLGTLTSAASAGTWATYAGGPDRLFFNRHPGAVTRRNVANLQVKWKVHVGGPVTASPSITTLNIPGEGRTQLAFIPSWDHNLYALRTRDGSELWHFTMTDQPGSAYPDAASTDVQRIDGAERVIVAGGETVYAVDASTGREIWRFDAGTGCGAPPGDCGFGGPAPETNEVESSPIVAGGAVFFGMDINENGIDGKGGFYAVDAHDGHLLWYFDVETGATCQTLRGDDIRRFDGYHSESDLGLPPGFLASRPGCGFDRRGDGCGGVWSTASVDARRRMLFFGSSACGESENALPYEEAIVALRFDGTPAWHWKPRPVDPNDLDFGAAPNLFSIRVGGRRRDVLGIGGKDGTYYALDRTGVNAVTSVRWDAPDPSGLPYWRTNLVLGGSAGGIIGTSAVDPAAGRIFISTAPGSDNDLLNPQRPTVHALDAADGAIVWQNTTEADADASFAPTSAIPGVVFVGKDVGGALRAYDAATGAKLASFPVGLTLASAPAVVGGLVIVGSGSGARGPDPTDLAEIEATLPVDITAFCVAKTRGCKPQRSAVR